jgi:hypothetical protein
MNKATFNLNWKTFLSALDSSASPEISDYPKYEYRKLATLLQAEIANEKQHRRGYNSEFEPQLTVNEAAKVIILANVARGASMESAPEISLFLTIRPAAAEAIAIGWYLRADLPKLLISECKALNYADMMRDGFSE